jgi:transcriptional regulator with XRE-family HTH domain
MMNMDKMRAQIAVAIKAERERRNMRRTEFAKVLGISRANYGQVEIGKRCLTLVHIHNAHTKLGIPLDVLLAPPNPLPLEQLG